MDTFNKVIKVVTDNKRHPKCKGFMTPDVGFGSDADCYYNTKIDCDECRYNIYGTCIKLMLNSDDCYKIGYDIINNYINRITDFDDNIIEFIMYLLYDNEDSINWAKSIVLKNRHKFLYNHNYLVIARRTKDLSVIDEIDIIKRIPGDDINDYGKCGKADNIIGDLSVNLDTGEINI